MSKPAEQTSILESKNDELKNCLVAFYNDHIGEGNRKWKVYTNLKTSNPERVEAKTNKINQDLGRITSLIEEGADCNLRCDISGSEKITPLNISLISKDKKLVFVLLEKGAIEDRYSWRGLELTEIISDPLIARVFTESVRNTLKALDNSIACVDIV
ncbi:MAG: hypothetical protein KGQ36_01465 [Rickettsiales bacterium]|nr:hypothetical protein [Rickettsiales bacterium]